MVKPEGVSFVEFVPRVSSLVVRVPEPLQGEHDLLAIQVHHAVIRHHAVGVVVTPRAGCVLAVLARLQLVREHLRQRASANKENESATKCACICACMYVVAAKSKYTGGHK